MTDTPKEENFAIGDIVEPIEGKFQLASGCERYSCAIVVSLDPFILVSECTTMRWQSTVKPEYFRTIGTVSDELLSMCLKRV